MLFRTTLLGLGLAVITSTGYTAETDIYTVHFSDDGKNLITGGSGGYTLAKTDKYTGGIKIWNSKTGALVKAMGQRSDLDTVFGNEYGRVGSRRWGISNFKDVVLSGSYPNGKVILLPSSLGRMTDNKQQRMPDFIGGYMDFKGHHLARIKLSQLATRKGDCDPKSGLHDYVGPVVPSNNGRYAAVVTNICKTIHTGGHPQVAFEYRSDLQIMDLNRFRIIKTVRKIDAGVYALGITDDGKRVAFVGRNHFEILDLDTNKQHMVETYDDSGFMIPRQFSTLQFSKDGSKLISLRNIYDIETGAEQSFKWADGSSKKPHHISSIKVAPDLSYFAMVIPKRSLIMFGDDGLPHSYGKADKVILLDTETGKRMELEVTQSMTKGKRCVMDISPDSDRVAVGCKGGLLRVYSARTGKLLWHKQNIGQQHHNGLINVQYDISDRLFALM